MRFYVESQRHKAITKLLGILGMLPFALLIFTGILKGMGEDNSFVRICVKLCYPAAFISAVLLGAAAYVYFKNRQLFTLTYLPQGGMEIIIRDPDGKEHGASGRWSCHALYTKHYHKYGTYRKEIYVILFCNDKMFCVLEHEIAPAFPPPQGFGLLESAPVVFVPWYHTRKTEEIYGRVKNAPQVQQQPVAPYGSRRDAQI